MRFDELDNSASHHNRICKSRYFRHLIRIADAEADRQRKICQRPDTPY
jgi:hypothetical protein